MVWPMYVSSFLPLISLFLSHGLFFFLSFELVHLDLLLVSALLLEFAAQSSIGISKEISQHSEELSPLRYYFFVFCFMPQYFSSIFISGLFQQIWLFLPLFFFPKKLLSLTWLYHSIFRRFFWYVLVLGYSISYILCYMSSYLFLFGLSFIRVLVSYRLIGTSFIWIT